MNLSLPQLVIGVTGALLIYSAVKNVSPVQVVKDALNGQVTAATPKEDKPVYGPYDPMVPLNGGPGLSNVPNPFGGPLIPASPFGTGALYGEGIPNSGIPVTSGTPNKILSV